MKSNVCDNSCDIALFESFFVYCHFNEDMKKNFLLLNGSVQNELVNNTFLRPIHLRFLLDKKTPTREMGLFFHNKMKFVFEDVSVIPFVYNAIVNIRGGFIRLDSHTREYRALIYFIVYLYFEIFRIDTFSEIHLSYIYDSVVTSHPFLENSLSYIIHSIKKLRESEKLTIAKGDSILQAYSIKDFVDTGDITPVGYDRNNDYTVSPRAGDLAKVISFSVVKPSDDIEKKAANYYLDNPRASRLAVANEMLSFSGSVVRFSFRYAFELANRVKRSIFSYWYYDCDDFFLPCGLEWSIFFLNCKDIRAYSHLRRVCRSFRYEVSEIGKRLVKDFNAREVGKLLGFIEVAKKKPYWEQLVTYHRRCPLHGYLRCICYGNFSHIDSVSQGRNRADFIFSRLHTSKFESIKRLRRSDYADDWEILSVVFQCSSIRDFLYIFVINDGLSLVRMCDHWISQVMWKAYQNVIKSSIYGSNGTYYLSDKYSLCAKIGGTIDELIVKMRAMLLDNVHHSFSDLLSALVDYDEFESNRVEILDDAALDLEEMVPDDYVVDKFFCSKVKCYIHCGMCTTGVLLQRLTDYSRKVVV